MHNNFRDFNISDTLLVALSEMGFEEPTPIQRAAVPPALKGKDVIGQAQTGTGKTAAFGIPLVEQRPQSRSLYPYGIVVVPTRELAIQVSREMNKMGKNSGVTALPVYGGQSIELQLKSLRKGIDIVVGTPGRVLDHIYRKSLVLGEIRTVVLDEADEMLNMGFIEDIEKILAEVPEKRQTMLFSATMPEEILRISRKYLTKPVQVGVDAREMVVAKISQVFYEVRDEDKIKALARLLDVESLNLTLVFCHTKREVDDVSAALQQMGYPAGAIHGDFTQAHRDEMMQKFRNGDIYILVATDVAARGLDIPDVSHVINYSIPQDPEGYIHRIGRTGRAGRSGIAITFVTPREYRHLRLIEKTAGARIKKGKLPTVEQVKRAREDDLESRIEKQIIEGKHLGLASLVERLSQRFSPGDVSAAAISMLLDTGEIEEIEDPGREKEFVRLFMTVGRKDNIKVGDIVKSITAEAGIPARKIGNIALFDKFSIVEVSSQLADKVILAVNDRIMKGRKVKVGRDKGRKNK